MKKHLTSLLFFFCLTLSAQENNLHTQSTSYEWPADPLVLNKLHSWQDLKFGVLLHWGIYS
ncbi:MAG: alpha-L-fucosidase, partial [Bacteroidaceae bacterium]|nr:alpha-L-fucosidase [Bacteroidaceae bacterium]